MARILIVSLSDPARDPRVNKQIRYLSGRHTVSFMGYGKADIAGVHWIDLGRRDPGRVAYSLIRKILVALRDGSIPVRLIQLLIMVLPRWFGPLLAPIEGVAARAKPIHRQIGQGIVKGRYDLILANDLSALVPCDDARGAIPLIYDAHEYSPGQYSNPRKLKGHLPGIVYELRKRLPRIQGMVTVSRGIAREYARRFGIQEPGVVANAALYCDMEPSGVLDDRIRLVHHGLAGRGRALETMIDAVSRLDDRFTLDLYLVNSNPEYLRELVDRAASCGRISFHPPVPPGEITPMLNNYDIGIVLYPPATFNIRHMLPNKFFEFIQGRIAVATGPYEEMGAIVREWGFGVVADDFTAEALAACLRPLDRSAVAKMKACSHGAAKALSGEHQLEILGGVVEQVLTAPQRSPPGVV